MSRALDSADHEAIPWLVHPQQPARGTSGELAFGDGVPHERFHGIRANLRVPIITMLPQR